MGTTAGAQRMQAMVVGATASGALTQNFDATALAAAADTVFATRGNGQSGCDRRRAHRFAGRQGHRPVRESSERQLRSSGRRPEAGPSARSRRRTGTIGTAATARVLGATAGPQGATATAAGLKGSPVVFALTAVPAAPTSLVKASGDNQSGSAGSAVAESLVVRLLDGSGNGVPGRNVTFAVATGGGIDEPHLGHDRRQRTRGDLVDPRQRRGPELPHRELVGLLGHLPGHRHGRRGDDPPREFAGHARATPPDLPVAAPPVGQGDGPERERRSPACRWRLPWRAAAGASSRRRRCSPTPRASRR